jgi:hypothetical protein
MPKETYQGTKEEIEALHKSMMEALRNDKGFGARKKKTEEPLRVVITGKWYVSAKNILDEPIEYGITAHCAFKRDMATGWEMNECVVFQMGFYTGKYRGVKKAAPIVGVTVVVGTQFEILEENVFK